MLFTNASMHATLLTNVPYRSITYTHHFPDKWMEVNLSANKPALAKVTNSGTTNTVKGGFNLKWTTN